VTSAPVRAAGAFAKLVRVPRRRSLALLLAVALLPACGAERDGAPAPGVLLVAVDGLRADHLRVYGYDRDTAPNLSTLAAEGVRFEQVFASAPLLIPAHVALLTGSEPTLARRLLLPDLEGPDERRWVVSARGVQLAVELLAAGYATAAFLDHPLLGEVAGLRQGFQRFEVLDAKHAAAWEGEPTRRAAERFLQWLRALPDGRPWFAYLHLNQLERCWSSPTPGVEAVFEPRAELAWVPPIGSTDDVFFAVPRSRWRGGPRTLGHYEALYDNELRALDRELGHLRASLRRLGREDATALHVVGSFGLQLGEAGLYLSAGRYSQADLGVPWIFRPRGATAARGRSVPGLVSTVDVAPTLLALEGLRPPRAMSGRAQDAVARSADARVAEREFVTASCGLQGGCALIGEQHVLEYLVPEVASDAQLRRSWFGEWTEFDRRLGLSFYARARLARPPLQAEPLVRTDADFARMRDLALEWRNRTNEARHLLQAPPGRSGLDAAALARLWAEGYEAAAP
jgi:arylsulfatase A-like enzyme